MMVDRYDGYELTKCSNGGIVLYEDYQKLENQLADLKERLRWIPLTERLPGKFKSVLVSRDGYPEIRSLYDDPEKVLVFSDGYTAECIQEFTHWMEVPFYELHNL